MSSEPISARELRQVIRRLEAVDERYRQALETGGGALAPLETLRSLLRAADLDIAWVASAEDGEKLRIAAVAGTATNALNGLEIAEGAGLTGKVFLSQQADWVDQYLASARITHHFDDVIESERIVRLLAVPIVRNGHPAAVLTVGSRTEGSFGDRAVSSTVAAANGLALSQEVAERGRRTVEAAAHHERRKAALDLHDTLGAMLYSIGVDARDLRESDAVIDEAIADRLARISDRTAEAAALLREVLRNLHASPTEIALGAALQGDCQCFQERTGITATVMFLTDLPVIPQATLSVVVRAFREALLNVEKHANATAIAVTASVDNDGLNVAVTDDGAGLQCAGEESEGLGLTGSRDAVTRIGGRLQLHDGSGGGAVWRLTIPL